MAIVGFSFTKIDVERKKSATGSISVKNNVNIDNLEETDMQVGTQKQKVLKITFNYKSEFQPEVGYINLSGEIIYMNEAKQITETLNNWKNKKQMPNEVMTPVVNNILSRSNILALSLTKEVGLPPQLKLPRVQVKSNNN